MKEELAFNLETLFFPRSESSMCVYPLQPGLRLRDGSPRGVTGRSRLLTRDCQSAWPRRSGGGAEEEVQADCKCACVYLCVL